MAYRSIECVDVLAVGWGVVVTVSSLVAWGGQVVAASAPERAIRWGLLEDPDDVDPAFWHDARGEATWDALTLWVMVVAGVLLIAVTGAWAPFGLVGGGAYLYFAGRGIAARLAMRRAGVQIGAEASVRMALAALWAWGAIAAVTIVAAVISLA